MPRSGSGDRVVVGRKLVAAPDNMQIGPDQHEVATVDIPSGTAFDLKDVEASPNFREGVPERIKGCAGRTKADERVFVADPIVQRLAIIEPDVR